MGTPNLVLVLSETRCSGRKDFKEREKRVKRVGGGGGKSRAAVKGGEREIMGCEVMRLVQGFKKVHREKRAFLCKINTCISD